MKSKNLVPPLLMKPSLLLGLFSLFLIAPLQAKPPSLNAQLLSAIQKGDTERAQNLVSKGASVNARNQSGQTPLMLAAKKSNRALVDFLLQKGANVNAQDDKEFSALGYGPMFAETFLKHGARATSSDAEALSDWFEKMLTADSGVKPEEAKAQARILLRAGMNLNTVGFDNTDATPLLNAVDSRSPLVAFLLDSGADVNLCNDSGRTPLMEAISPGIVLKNEADNSVALLLLNRGAKLNACDTFGKTALMEAVYENNLTIARELIKRGANVNIRDEFGESALMQAASNGQPKMVRLLLELGAEANLKDFDGQTALDYAKGYDPASSTIVVPATSLHIPADAWERLYQQAKRAAELQEKGRVEVLAILKAKKK